MSNAIRAIPKRPTMPDEEPDFIELPSSPGGAERATVKEARRPRRSADERPRLPEAIEEPPRPWSERVARFLFGDEGAGFGMSLVVHIVLMAVLAIPMLHQANKGPIIATTVTESSEAPVEFAENLNTELALPDEGGGQSQFELPDLTATESRPITQALFQDPASIGNTENTGVGDFAEGMATLVPENAVTAGSFTAFTTPTFNAAFPKRFGMAEPQPGDAPQPRQPYYITIQIKVPGDRKTYPLSDLSGTVMGTDGWRQSFPFDRFRSRASVFVMTKDGRLVRPSNTLRVVDGVVQIVVVVPGAVALVKDVIQVESKLLEEAQTLELVFEEQPPDE
jgi:hypothetical protein